MADQGRVRDQHSRKQDASLPKTHEADCAPRPELVWRGRSKAGPCHSPEERSLGRNGEHEARPSRLFFRAPTHLAARGRHSD